jgi:two-component system CheB/CheR fusion protein
MAREGLRHELGLGIKKAQIQAEVVQFTGLTVGTQSVNLSVQSISNPEALRGSLIVVFTDVATPVKAVRRTAVIAQKELLRELQQAREQIQTMREEMQSSQEELKSTNEEMQSTNEEMQSTNEELQSTNEELTTSKEGMQSLNEELQTVNAELQSKVDDLSWVNNDMKNLLNSTEIATVFLDNALNVRRFTTHCTQLFKLIAGDVGRPLSDIVMDLDYANLQQDANEVLRSLAFIEKQVATKDGRWFKVRIMPYRTQDNVIDGVVITFADISNFKALEAELRKIRP